MSEDGFDPRRMGCPLHQLKISCHQARADLDCPKFRKFLVRSTVTGADDAIWACADWWLPLLQRDAVAVMARTEKAVETRGDELLAAANQQARLLLLTAGAGVELQLQSEVDEIRARHQRLLPPPAPASAPAIAAKSSEAPP